MSKTLWPKRCCNGTMLLQQRFFTGIRSRSKILIVDDSEINRAQLREILGDTYEDLEGESGTGAVDILRRHTDIALVMLDLSMPEMNGFDVLRAVRSTPVEGCPEVKLSASIGSVCGVTPVREAIRQADAQMYRCKAGRKH